MTELLLTMGLMFAPGTSAPKLDYSFFKDRVQPILLKKRPGHARCVTCHQHGSPALQPLSPGATTWNDEQSRRNFEAAQHEVVPGDLKASRILTHPLAAEAGGDEFHGGGKHWDSENNPEWQALADWVRGKTLVREGSR